MLSDKQVKIIVRDVNKELDIPIVRESTEGALLNGAQCCSPSACVIQCELSTSAQLDTQSAGDHAVSPL